MNVEYRYLLTRFIKLMLIQLNGDLINVETVIQ